MAIQPGSKILAAQFNSLRNRTASLLGSGVDDFGYGQPLTATEVSPTTVISASRMQTLEADMGRVHRHQTGNALPLSTIESGDIVGANQSGTDTTKGFNDYSSLLSTLELNRFTVAPSQVEVEPSLALDVRDIQWSYITITSEAVFSFETASARRHFFNAGGEIHFSGDVTNLGNVGDPSYSRNLGWENMITNPGRIEIGYNYIRVSGSDSGVTFQQTLDYGNYQLEPNYKEVFRKKASTGVYDSSYWTLEARADDSSTLRFRIRLVDAGPESDTDSGEPGSVDGGVSEPVTADITLSYGARRPLGNPAAQSVSLPYPVVTVTRNFQ